MTDADKKSSEVKQLKKKISNELNEIDKDIKNMEKAKKDSVEKIEIKKVELKKFSNTQAVCDEHYATLQEIEQASKLIEERKISITALDETIANLDTQISKIQSEHDKAVAELEKKRMKLNEYLKYYEDLNDKLEKLIQLLGEEEKKHCIELNNLKVERARTLNRTDLSENALNKLLQQLDEKMVDLNVEHGKLIDSISQKLSEITVETSGVEELLSEKKAPSEKKKKKAAEKTEGGDEGKKTDEEGASDEEEVKAKEEEEKPATAKSDGSRKEVKADKKPKSGSEGKGEAGKKDQEPELKDEQKKIEDEESGEEDYESGDQEGSVAKGKKKFKKKPSKLETKVEQQLKKLEKKKIAKKAGAGTGAGGEDEEDEDADVDDSFDIDEELQDWFSSNEKDVRLDLLRQGMQITPSNRIITPDDRIITLKQAQRLGLLEEGAEEDEETESSDYEGTRSKKKKKYNKQLKYYQSPASSASTLGKESSESRICGRDVEYLKVVFGKALTIALAEITAIQPVDPIHYLAHWMLKYRYNQEIEQVTRIQIQELMIEQERLAAEKWHRELQEEARLAVLEALFRAENIIIQQDFQSQLLQEYEGE